MTSQPSQQMPGVFHRRVGSITVTALHDGHQDAAMATVKNIPLEDAASLLHAAFRPVPRRTAVNVFLVRTPDHTVLIDTGCGSGAKPTVGFLQANLHAAGVAPAAIDTVLMTHLHPDHFGGLADREGTALYPNAELVIHAAEYAYWHDDAAMMQVADPARRQTFFGDARARLAPYKARTRTFTGESEVLPGITAVPLPGHTPGHTGYMIASDGATLLIWGDIVHVQEIQVPRPDATMAVDVDPAQAVETRRRIFDRVIADRQAIAGMHLHFPAMAHMRRHGDGYVLIPDAWSMVLDGDAQSNMRSAPIV